MLAILLVAAVSALLSFFCSLSEAALYAITPSKIEELSRAGHTGGRRLVDLRARIDEAIAAILTLNTIANSLGATIAGSLVGRYYAEHGNIATLVFGVLFTLLVLYFSEIIPKTLGVTHAERLAPVLALPIQKMIWLFKPMIWTSRGITRLIRRQRSADADAPSEQEILALAEMGRRAGTLLEDEARWAVNALRLNDVAAKDLMTPRIVVTMLPADLPVADAPNYPEHWAFSRLPIVNDNDPDDVAGIVHRRDVFDNLVHKPRSEWENKTLRDLARPAVFVPETIRCNELLRRFITTRQHLIVVTNEYGGMEGIISLEDVIEFMLGEEIVDPFDRHIDMQEYARRLARRRLETIKPPAGPVLPAPPRRESDAETEGEEGL